MQQHEKKIETAIIIIVDSVRYYRSGVDDRDRLEIMDQFSQDAVEFTNAFTSAPSSVMSAAAMFTGMDSCFLARNYNDWEFDNRNVVSLQQVLEKHDYEIYTIDNSRVGREIKRDLTMPINKKYYPKGISHANFWTNLELTRILKNVLEMGVKKKSLFMLWYDCRNDPNTSVAVEQALDLFKEHGLYDDSVMIMTSDHGYPDPRSGLNKNTMRNMRHDMVVTDDNIKVPLFIKSPGASAYKSKNTVSLVDLTPTILDLLDVNDNDNDARLKNITGKSLKKKLYKNDNQIKDQRIIRSDTRLLLQKGRITALRNNQYKYVIYHDEEKFELFDIETDPNELAPLIVDDYQDIVEIFDSFFKKQQSVIDKFHIEDLESRVVPLITYIQKNKIKRVLISTEAPKIILDPIVNNIKSCDNSIVIDYLSKNKVQHCEHIFNKVFTIEDTKKMDQYDLSIIVNEKSHFNFDNPLIYKVCEQHSRKSISLDYNLKMYSRFMAKWVYPVLKYRKNWYFYKQEPILILKDIWKLASLGFKIHVLKDKTKSPDMQIVKQLRDRAMAAQKEKESAQGK